MDVVVENSATDIQNLATIAAAVRADAVTRDFTVPANDVRVQAFVRG